MEKGKIRFGANGIHIFKRETGLNILVDERIPPSHLWTKCPRQVSIALTNTCNLNCSYCYAPKHSATLNFRRLIGWLDELDANGCIGVGFGGGEPTLYPHLVELCSHVMKNTNLAITLTTHAHNLSKKLLSELKDNLHFVRVSMDGVGSTYEFMRGRSFETLCKNIRKLKTIVPIGINYVVNSTTFNDLDAAAKLVADFGASEFLLLPEEPTNGSHGINHQTILALRKWVSSYNGKVPLSISENHSEGFPVCNSLNKEKGLDVFAHIDASGILKRTSYDNEGVDIQNNGVMDALGDLKKMKQSEGI